MKRLPKYFVIKRDASNPLWQKYIGWLTPNYCEIFNGQTWHYYGIDGSNPYNKANMCDKLSDFQNNPTLITLEEWNECVNEVKQEESRGYFTFQNWTL